MINSIWVGPRRKGWSRVIKVEHDDGATAEHEGTVGDAERMAQEASLDPEPVPTAPGIIRWVRDPDTWNMAKG